MLRDFLSRSAVSPAFAEAVEAFLATGRPNDRIVFHRGAPPVKVERTLTKAVATYADLPIESVEIIGESGCEYYRGTLKLTTSDEARRVAFTWDCRWKAEQQGWKDFFGFPDQMRAAMEFGHDCFRSWVEQDDETAESAD